MELTKSKIVSSKSQRREEAGRRREREEKERKKDKIVTPKQDRRQQGKTRDTKANKRHKGKTRHFKRHKNKTRDVKRRQDYYLLSCDFATGTDMRLKWTLTLKAREDRQSTRQSGGHGREIHNQNHVNAVVDEADAAERHFAYNRRQDKIKQDNRKTRPLQDNTCFCPTVKADKQKFSLQLHFLPFI